jgi:hypothetical protein
VGQLSEELLSLESRISLDEDKQQQPSEVAHSPQDMQIPGAISVAFPELTRVPIFGIEAQTDMFQFEWP